MAENIILSSFGTAAQSFRGSSADDAIRRDANMLNLLAIAVQDFNLEKEVVALAWEAARWQDGLEPGERQALLLLVLCALVMQQQGSTRVPLRDEEGAKKVAAILEVLLKPRESHDPGLASAGEMITAMLTLAGGKRAESVIGSEGEFKPFLFDGANLYSYKLLRLEQRIVKDLQVLLAGKKRPVAADAWKLFLQELDTGPVMLDAEQKEAVRKAVESPFCIITGGPGTGKTTVIVSILKALLQQGVAPNAIALAAPTGKAANRMGESILAEKFTGISEPQTLHRLLGYSLSRDVFKQHRNNPLTAEVVIVDEASMIDLYLVERLLGAMRPDGRLILIGDAEQLPSVDAGAVFKDLVSIGQGYVARLENSYRMKDEGPGRAIFTLAQEVRKGSIERLFDAKGAIVERKDAADLAFTGVELYEPQATGRGLLAFLDAWAERFLPQTDEARKKREQAIPYTKDGFSPGALMQLDAIVAPLNGFKVLALTRAYRSGIEAINRYFHVRAARAFARDGVAGGEFLPGEPVMMLHNDYDRNIFNGDQGVILNVSAGNGDPRPMAVFRQGTGYAAFPIDALRSSLVHSYAITVHKSQGSEYEHVALILPDQEIPILTRELIYTGVTRSKLSLSIIGSRDILKAGVSQAMKRFSGISERMTAP